MDLSVSESPEKLFLLLKNENIKLHILGDGKDKNLLLSQKEKLGLDVIITS